MGEIVRDLVRVVGRYAIFDELAAGGMATVYLGRLMGSGGFTRTVAIKRLHAQFAKDPEFVAMFLDEARLAARIRHPNVVPTLDVVASKGEVFLVMEYVQGETLGRLMRRLKSRSERVPLPVLLRVVSDMLQGLHAAHEATDERGIALEIVHRDVSPQNVLVGVDGIGRLLDFGVAKATGRAHMTRDGQLKGKLSYMAPEQFMNLGVTRATDVYAASVVLWEALTGARLFKGETEFELIGQLINREIRKPSDLVPDLPPGLVDVVMRGLAKDPGDRFATAREMCVALGKCGIPEAPSIAVGEWVENLAADTLADRTAKIAAIETHPGSPSSALRAVRSPSVYPSGGSEPPPPTLSAPLVDAPPREPAPSDEPRSDVLSVSLNLSPLHLGTRMRLWGAAGALALVLLGGVVVFSRSVNHRPAPSAGVAANVPPSGSVTPSAATSTVGEPAAVPVPQLPIEALPSASSAPAQATRPSALSSAPPPRSVPRASPPRRDLSKAVDHVFDSRE